MFRLLSRLILSLFSNLIALWLAVYFIKGFEIAPGFNNFLLVAAVFTFLNIFIRPILKLILTPVIVLTLGLAIFLINAFMLYLLDNLLTNITITGTLPLIYATLIITVVNLVINFVVKKTHSE